MDERVRLTSLQAFRKLINVRGIQNELNISLDKLESVRTKVNDHALDDPTAWGITAELMHSWLEKYGYKRIDHNLWELP